MVSLLVYFGMQVLALYGLGLLFHKFLRRKPDTVGETGLYGIILAIIIASLWSLFFPLLYLGYVLVSTGIIASFLLSKRRLSIFSIALLLVFLFPLYISVPQYDTGLYHLSQLLFEREYSLPLGLANFHGRLGFNSIWLPYSAAMGVGKDWIISSFLVNASLLYFVAHFIWEKISRYERTFADLSLLVLLGYLAIQMYIPHDLGGPNTDFSSQLFGVIGLYYFLSHFVSGQKYHLEISILIVVFSVLLKFSNVGVAIIPVIYGLYLLKGSIFKSRIVLVSVFAVIIWISRSIILTGCLVGVVDHSCMPVAWSASVQMDHASSWVQSWSRHPGLAPEIVLADYSWLWKYWLPAIWTQTLVKMVAVLASLFLLKLTINIKHLDGVYNQAKLVLISLIIFFVVWFIGAPDYRFASIYLAYSMSILIAIIFSNVIHTIRILIKPALVTALCLLLAISSVRTIKYWQQLNDAWPRFSTPSSQIAGTTEIGLEIRSVLKGDQCFDIPFCTPEYSESISVEKKWGRLFFTRE